MGLGVLYDLHPGPRHRKGSTRTPERQIWFELGWGRGLDLPQVHLGPSKTPWVDIHPAGPRGRRVRYRRRTGERLWMSRCTSPPSPRPLSHGEEGSGSPGPVPPSETTFDPTPVSPTGPWACERDLLYPVRHLRPCGRPTPPGLPPDSPVPDPPGPTVPSLSNGLERLVGKSHRGRVGNTWEIEVTRTSRNVSDPGPARGGWNVPGEGLRTRGPKEGRRQEIFSEHLRRRCLVVDGFRVSLCVSLTRLKKGTCWFKKGAWLKKTTVLVGEGRALPLRRPADGQVCAEAWTRDVVERVGATPR